MAEGHRGQPTRQTGVNGIDLLTIPLLLPLPAAEVFRRVPDESGAMLRADLEEAQIPYVDDTGRSFDFHCLRRETATLLAASGVHPKTAQKIMRHQDINLTMSLYTHVLRDAESAAVNALPNLGPDDRPQAAAG